jgi:hypothetical protein
MKTTMMAAAMLMAGMGGAIAQTPAPADWTTMTLTADIAKPAAAAWKLVGGEDWCGIGKYLGAACKVDSGDGGLGSLRTINGTIVEIVVARTPLSYTYAQPFTPIFYHGTMSVEPVDGGHSRLVYTLIWNQNALADAKARADAYNGRKTRFQAAVDKMAADANAAP